MDRVAGKWTTLLAFAVACWVLPAAGQRGDIEITKKDYIRCSMNRIELRIICANATIEEVMTSSRELIPSASDSVQPIHMEIVNSSRIVRLPYVFPRFNRTLKIVKVTHTTLRFVYPDAFAHMGRTLVHLDLSHNKLVSLPYALANLTALEYLDLSHNRIFVFDGSEVFRSPINLLTLDVSHNALGVAGVSYDEAAIDQEHAVRDHVTEKHISIGDAVNSVQYLDLSENRLADLPEMFIRRQFSYLKVLKLTNNSVPEYPEVLRRFLPRLQRLYLENNAISWLPSYALQSGLKFLDYTGNPMHCTCDTLRLRQFVKSNNIIASFPKCNIPEFVKGVTVKDLPETLCRVETSTSSSTTEASTPEPVVYMTAKTRLTNVTSNHESITLLWSVDFKPSKPGKGALREGDKIKWYAIYRQFGTQNRTTLKISSDVPSVPGNQSYEYTISNLLPVTGYVVCFRTRRRVASKNGNSLSIYLPNFCREVNTVVEETFPVVEVAVATTVSTSTTMAIVAFCCFCCPKSLCKRKKKKKKTKTSSSCGGSEKRIRQNSKKHLFEASETEMETSKSTIENRYDSKELDETQVDYIDYNDLMYSHSSPNLTMANNETVGDPYLEPLKPKKMEGPISNVAFHAFRMNAYLDGGNFPERRGQYRRQSTNVTDGQSESDSEAEHLSKSNVGSFKTYSRWHDGKFLNYIRPMSADNVSPTSSTSSTDAKPHERQFFFPRAYATYR